MTPRNTRNRIFVALLLAVGVVSACHRSLTPPAGTQPTPGAEQSGAASNTDAATSAAPTGGPPRLDEIAQQAAAVDAKKATSVAAVTAEVHDASTAATVPAQSASAPAAEPANAPAPMPPTSTCVTAKCHAKLLSGSDLHPVAEGCDSCHEATGAGHPVKGTKGFKLTQSQPDLCYTCHDAFGKKKTVHPPVAEGTCTTCHDPHSSNQPKLLAQSLGETCKTCHADIGDSKVTHGPVSAGDCVACHSPHESDQPSLLVRTGEQLCVGCHTDMQDVLQKKNVHPALVSGCTSCHNPHGGKFARMLDKQGPELCFGCHSDIQDAVKESTVPHPALDTDAGCASCHSPHASDNDKLLLKPQKDTCLECHDDVIPKNVKFQHGPNNDGVCSRCHAPHGSKYEKLLVGEFPPDAYVPYTDKEYGLCFSCHKRDLLEYPQTSFATGFRDGEKNLHYVHVNNERKGRSCRLCHSWHGSNNPKLIADTVTFGKWNLPLRFVKTDTGGGCTPGCHKPQYYDREQPGRKPVPQAAKPADGAPAAPGGGNTGLPPVLPTP